MNKLIINTSITIRKPIHEVFDAIVNPEKMVHYFISESSGKMESGKVIQWKFPEFEIVFPIKVLQVVENQLISYSWEINNQDLTVEIKLEEKSNQHTLIQISEAEMDNNEQGINWLKGNTEGWANFLACLKAYLEFGINLRTGSFEHKKI